MAGPQSCTVNGSTYYDLTEALPESGPSAGTVVSGTYMGISKATPNPTGSLKTVQFSKVAFPGTFDGVATIEITYEPNMCEISFAIVDTLAGVATRVAALNAVLVRSDAARYSVTIPGYPTFNGCKLVAHKFYEDIPLGGKVLVHLHCVFEALSLEN